MEKYFIGIDGGGTKSSVLVSDGEKDKLYFRVGGLNYNSFSKEDIIENIHAIEEQLENSGYSKEQCKGICVGTAGVSNRNAVDFLESAFKKLGYDCKILITGDEVIALKGAFKEEQGILLISGTGSICYGQGKDGKTFRAGGYGHLIDDGGSAYALARDILHEVVMEADGRRKRTVLTDAVFDFLNLSSVEELISYIYDKKHSKKDIAAIAQIMNDEEVKTLDVVADIAKKEAVELTECVRTVYMQLQQENENIPMVLSGSVLLKNEVLREIFFTEMEKSLPKVKIVEAKNDAVHGAVFMLNCPDDGYCVQR